MKKLGISRPSTLSNGAVVDEKAISNGSTDEQHPEEVY